MGFRTNYERRAFLTSPGHAVYGSATGNIYEVEGRFYLGNGQPLPETIAEVTALGMSIHEDVIKKIADRERQKKLAASLLVIDDSDEGESIALGDLVKDIVEKKKPKKGIQKVGN